MISERAARFLMANGLAATEFELGGSCPSGIDDGVWFLVDESLSRYGTIDPAAGAGAPMIFAQRVAITARSVGDFTVAGETDEEVAG